MKKSMKESTVVTVTPLGATIVTTTVTTVVVTVLNQFEFERESFLALSNEEVENFTQEQEEAFERFLEREEFEVDHTEFKRINVWTRKDKLYHENRDDEEGALLAWQQACLS